MPIKIPNSLPAAAILEQENIFARKYFYPLTNELECYKEAYGASVANTPVAK